MQSVGQFVHVVVGFHAVGLCELFDCIRGGSGLPLFDSTHRALVEVANIGLVETVGFSEVANGCAIGLIEPRVFLLGANARSRIDGLAELRPAHVHIKVRPIHLISVLVDLEVIALLERGLANLRREKIQFHFDPLEGGGFEHEAIEFPPGIYDSQRARFFGSSYCVLRFDCRALCSGLCLA